MTKSKFRGTYLDFYNIYNQFIEFPEFNEKYIIDMPTVSAHNIVFGKMYTDIGGKSTIKSLMN